MGHYFLDIQYEPVFFASLYQRDSLTSANYSNKQKLTPSFNEKAEGFVCFLIFAIF